VNSQDIFGFRVLKQSLRKIHAAMDLGALPEKLFSPFFTKLRSQNQWSQEQKLRLLQPVRMYAVERVLTGVMILLVTARVFAITPDDERQEVLNAWADQVKTKAERKAAAEGRLTAAIEAKKDAQRKTDISAAGQKLEQSAQAASKTAIEGTTKGTFGRVENGTKAAEQMNSAERDAYDSITEAGKLGSGEYDKQIENAKEELEKVSKDLATDQKILEGYKKKFKAEDDSKSAQDTNAANAKALQDQSLRKARDSLDSVLNHPVRVAPTSGNDVLGKIEKGLSSPPATATTSRSPDLRLEMTVPSPTPP
jgi:hypothetical protein